MQNPDKPWVTIVTVVLNNNKCLEQTIQSVASQTYENVEHIIIDGGSTDGTLDVIRRYQSGIACWISEPDHGIYDAMNKGIDRARGEWINFLGAGDCFYEKTTLETIFSMAWEETDIIYGDARVVYPDGFVRIKRAGKPETLWRGMSISHQSVFAKTSLMRQYRFNPKNRIASDYEFVYKSFRNYARFAYINHVIASYLSGGMSDTNRVKAVCESWVIAKREAPSWKVDACYALLMARAVFIVCIKNMLTASTVQRLFQLTDTLVSWHRRLPFSRRRDDQS